MMKRILSAVVLASALLPAMAYVMPERVHHVADKEITDSILRFALPRNVDNDVTVEVRAMPVREKERPGVSRQAWGLEWPDGLRIELRNGNSAFGDAADTRFTRVTVSRMDSTMFVKEFDRGFASLPGHANTLIVTRNAASGAVSVSGGGRTPVKVGDFILPPPQQELDSVTVSAQGKMRVLLASTEFVPDLRSSLLTDWTREALAEHFAQTADPMECFWSYFDRENNPDYSRPGGRYTLATVGDGAGGYTILYVDGAETYPDRWKACMVKGRLRPTVFVGQYDLEWVDSEFERITRDIHAHVDDSGSLLILEFPLMKMRMRFAKMPLVRDF